MKAAQILVYVSFLSARSRLFLDFKAGVLVALLQTSVSKIFVSLGLALFPPHCMGHLVLAKAVRRLTEYDYCIVRWGFEDIELLHAFDYVKGTPAMVTWVAQSVFLFGFNASVWLLFRGLGMVCSMCSGNERKVKSN